MIDIDARLTSLFAAPPAAPDEEFVRRIDCAVVAERKMLAAQTAMWRRFAVEATGTVAVAAAFYLLWRMAPGETVTDISMHAPALAASMLMFMWLAMQAKQSAAAR